MKRELIAQVAHDINRAYCASLGDDSQLPWAEAPEEIQRSALAGVDMHLANPDATPEQSHEAWLAQKTADGWAYGEVKDLEKKLHPCFRPYDELPPEQKSKDYLFRGVVHALKDLPDVETNQDPRVADLTAELNSLRDAHAAALAQLRDGGQVAPALDPSLVAVAYIGRRPDFTDRVYGTNLTFVQGQVRPLPPDVARKLLRHPDQFQKTELPVVELHTEPGTDDTADILAQANKQQEQKHKEQSNLQDVRDQVAHMTKDALVEYAQTNYRQKLDKRSSVEALRGQVMQFVDQFGVV